MLLSNNYKAAVFYRTKFKSNRFHKDYTDYVITKNKLIHPKAKRSIQSLFSGKILSKYDGIIKANGLYKVKLGELVYVKKYATNLVANKQKGKKVAKKLYGLVFNLTKTEVGIMFFGSTKSIFVGQYIFRSGQRLKVPVGAALLGRIVDSLGTPLDGLKNQTLGNLKSLTEKKGPGIITRGSVNQPLHTGILVVDCLFPIGRGQRELIIGNKQTGKTSIALTSILSQNIDTELKKSKTYLYCVYVAIGQRKSSIAKIYNIFKKTKALKYTTIVSATADDSANLQFLAPYSGCTIAEYFRDRGKDALIIFDDLSKQAVCYRQASLLLERVPTRGAYPGDVFYLHSKLLERSAKLSPSFFGGSLTALPVIETVGGDITAYIPTNVISITDGQIFVDEDLFLNNIKPGINIRLSVSRIGSKAQILPIKKLASSFKNALVEYDEFKRFEVFDGVSAAIKQIIHRGKRLLEQVKQGAIQAVNIEAQLILISLSTSGFFDKFSITETKNFKNDVCLAVKNHTSLVNIANYKNLDINK
jgi:proton translocating ATP synthase F1 alpha subunit